MVSATWTLYLEGLVTLFFPKILFTKRNREIRRVFKIWEDGHCKNIDKIILSKLVNRILTPVKT